MTKKLDKINLRQLTVKDLTDIGYGGDPSSLDVIDTETFAQGLNDISSSFCIAKWKQTTLHLQNGHTHSCHHPATHKVPWQELTTRPSALHNTTKKMMMRDQMKNGVRPKECEYCWRVEDARQKKGDAWSDRIHKSRDHWALKHLPEILRNDATYDVPPSYLEVSFSNVCNFKCAYCAPHISSQWMTEIQHKGPYPTSAKFNNLDWIKKNSLMPIPNNKPNVYVEAFWKWFPEIYKDLEVFRITGGEPFLSKDTIKVLDFLADNPAPTMDLAINTNLCIPDKLFEQVMGKLKRLVVEKKIKRLQLYTSAEAHGDACDYIRFGMDYEKWYNNLRWIIGNIPDVDDNNPTWVTIMSTVNLLSLPSYTKFIQDISILKKEAAVNMKNPKLYERDVKNMCPVRVDFPYLRNPEFLTMFLYQNPDYKLEGKKWLEDAIFAAKMGGFNEFEIDRMNRLLNTYMGDQRWTQVQRTKHERDFKKYVTEYDKRRGTDFDATFPELKSFKDGIIL